MASQVGEMVEGFHTIGEFLNKVFKDKYAMYFLVLLTLWLLLNSLLKALLKKIPMFEGDGDRPVNAQGSVVAGTISLLMVLGIAWQARKEGPEAIVTAFAGPYGYYAIVLLTMLAGYLVYKNTENLSDKTRTALTAVGASIVYFYLTGYIYEGTGGWVVWIFSAIIGGIVLAFLLNRKSD